MNDERIEMRPSFDFENARNGLGDKSKRSQAIDRFGWERDHAAALQQFGGARYAARIRRYYGHREGMAPGPSRYL